MKKIATPLMKGISGTLPKVDEVLISGSSTLGSLCSFCLSHTIRSRKHNSTIPVSSLPFLELKLQSAQPGSDIAQRVIPYVMPDTLKVGQNTIATPKLITSPGHSEEVLPCWSRSSWATAIFGGLLGESFGRLNPPVWENRSCWLKRFF